MWTLLVAVVVLATSCGSNDELEQKVGELSKELVETQRRVDELAKEVANAKYLEKKLDELMKEQWRTRDLVAARPPPTRPARVEPDRAKTYAVPIDGAPSLGPADAKVTMVVAHEYACPYCEKVRPTLDDLRRKYGRDLRMVFKQLVVHPQTATAAALAICAAAKQQKYAQMDALLWDKGFRDRRFDTDAPATVFQSASRRCWDTPAGCPIVEGFARTLGMSISRFRSDMVACQAPLQQGMRELQSFGAAATPSFFINGRFMSGAMPIDNFSALIDEELAKATARIAQGTPRASYYQRWVLDEGLPRLEAPLPP